VNHIVPATDQKRLIEAPGSLTIGAAPEGADALILADLVRLRRARDLGIVHVYVARDDARAAAMAATLSFFAPDLELIDFPAWDCLPYDRVSPKVDIVSRRMAALGSLLAPPSNTSIIMITTANAVLQRVPPRDAIAKASLHLTTGNVLDFETLTGYLTLNGYLRAGTVREAGEYAVRGGIMDIFPPGLQHPIRLDMFGDTLESIREFDAESQRTIGQKSHITLLSVSEVPLDKPAIQRFRSAYVAEFGAVVDQDLLYQAVSEGRRHPGMEHWLPLFHDHMATIFDYLPPTTLIALDHLAEDARDKRLSAIDDYYQVRMAGLRTASQADSLARPPYKALAPHLLYLSEQEWADRMATLPTRIFSPFAVPQSEHTIDGQAKRGREFTAERGAKEINAFDAVAGHIAALQRANKRVYVAGWTPGSAERLTKLLSDHGIKSLRTLDNWPDALALPRGATGMIVVGIEHGFETPDIAIISEQDILGDRLVRPRTRRTKAADFISSTASLSQGDLVVHIDHGIGRYDGLKTISVSDAPHDCLLIIYHGGDKLYLPVENIELLSRYGSNDAHIQLDKLGGSGWQARKSKMKSRIRDMADELIKVAASRELRRADIFEPDAGLYNEFCARFPYEETEDQDAAIQDVLDDISKGRPADRLICGDVGFGKTEIALRSAFVVAMAGGQVAIVTPTTLLCRQHYQTFRDRFADWPIEIRQLSRMVSPKQANETKQGLANGNIDIVIGTHSLLAKSIVFKNLNLLIIDEEQHFGVSHKERLKQLRGGVHVVTLTATPIPRTLQLALSGVREMSLIATPPLDRLAVRTYVTPFDGMIIREALMREHYRGGQSFFVCPRISEIPEAAAFLRENVPEVKFATAHGQMPPGQLDDVMNAFYDGQYDVLLSTTIIESGLDIPSANTLVVLRADMFGLAQLYQLRGRIGRSKLRAYAYFTIPVGGKLTENAEKRLQVLQSLDSLGAGFNLASYDLDIRGAGNLLGEEQSGRIKEVGVELYQSMLEDAVASLRDEGSSGEEVDQWSPQINIGTSVLIPESYVPDLDVRLNLYRRLSNVERRQDIDGFAAELIDRFGPLPEEVEHLLEIVGIKVLCRSAGVDKVDAGPKGVTLSFRKDQFANPAGLVEYITQSRAIKLRPDHKLVVKSHWPTPEARLRGVKTLLEVLAQIAEEASAAA